MDKNELEKLFTPPDCMRGTKILNHSDFCKVIELPALRVDAKKCSVFLKNFRRPLLNQPRLKNIVQDAEDDKKKILLLSPGVLLNEEEEGFIVSQSATKITHKLELGYDFWTTDQVLRAVLPLEIVEVPSAFETIGHIAHLNLRDQQLEYKDIIGQVLLDKNSPQIKTVVNKTNQIDETFRFFKMELLAGDDDMMATVRECGCTFEFDFSKVYWNSRLQTEHKRLVDSFSRGDVICDMFAGVGPFAIPAAKKGCFVHANDLNPHSYQALLKNIKLNKVGKQIQAYNMDGREFVRSLVKKLSNSSSEMRLFDHVVMNLPASAVQFLDVFKGLLNSNQSLSTYPMVHCYCFSKADDPMEDAKNQAEDVLGVKLGSECNVYYVRDVAPKKAMMRISFRLSASIAVPKDKQEGHSDVSEPPAKQIKIS